MANGAENRAELAESNVAAFHGNQDDPLQNYRFGISTPESSYPKLELVRAANGTYSWQAFPGAAPELDEKRQLAVLKSLPGAQTEFDQTKYDDAQANIPGTPKGFDQAKYEYAQKHMPGTAMDFDQARYDSMMSNPSGSREPLRQGTCTDNLTPVARFFPSW